MESILVNRHDYKLLKQIAFQVSTDQSDYFNRFNRTTHIYEGYVCENLFKLKRDLHKLIDRILDCNKSEDVTSNENRVFVQDTEHLSNFRNFSVKNSENNKYKVMLKLVNQLENEELKAILSNRFNSIQRFVGSIETYSMNTNYAE